KLSSVSRPELQSRLEYGSEERKRNRSSTARETAAISGKRKTKNERVPFTVFVSRISFSRVLNHLNKLLKEIPAVRGSRRSFGMVLDGENGELAVAESFYRSIVQVHVGYFHTAGKRVRIDRVAMVLRRDVD